MIISEMIADILELMSRPGLTYSQVTFVAGASILGIGLSLRGFSPTSPSTV